MPGDEKTLKRIANLLRLVDKNSGAEPGERTNALAELDKMLTESGGTVADALAPPKRKRETPPPQPAWSTPPWTPPPPSRQSPPPSYRYVGHDFRGVVLNADATCAQCGRVIRAGEEAFYDPGEGYIHHDITCGG